MLGDDLPSVPLADALEAWDAAVEDAAAQDGAKLPDCGGKTLTHETFSFTWECDEDADAAPDREYLIDGLFGVGELSVIFGLPKAGKSHFALHIARGLPFSSLP